MKEQNGEDKYVNLESQRKAKAEATLWSALGTIVRWRYFIGVTTGIVAVASVVISLMLPNWYAAEARLLPPEGGSSSPLAAQLLSNLPSSASALLGGGSGDYTRYLAILTSRTLLEAAVDSFNLVEVYDTKDSKTPREDAIKMFSDNLELSIDPEYEFLSVSVYDTDPQRSADLTNFMVRKLNQRNAQLASLNASNYRRFIEKRYYEAQAALDSVLTATEAFQREYGLYDLPTQTQGFLEYLATLRANEIQARIQYEALLEQYGAENAQVQQLREIAEAANRSYRQAVEGREDILPVPQASVPGVARRYVDLERERLMQMRILEVVAPMYEQARFDEEKEIQAVQVVDEAIPPAKKARPKRSIIVIVATFSAFMLSVIYALVYTWWKRNVVVYARKLQEATSDPVEESIPISP